MQVYGTEWATAFETFFNRVVPGPEATNKEFERFVAEFTQDSFKAFSEQLEALIEAAYMARPPRRRTR